MLKAEALEGPLKIEGSPNCSYYRKQLPRSGLIAFVHDCYGPTKDSETGWGYQVSVSNQNEGEREIVRNEIDTLAAQIAQDLRGASASAKVTIRVMQFGLPWP